MGIYPGYYEFYHFGENYMSGAGEDFWYAMTLSPNYKLWEEDTYFNREALPEEAFVEVEEGENKRIYVIIGEEPFIIAATEEFEDWAIETESHYIEESAASGSHESIEVGVPSENLEGLLADTKPEVSEPAVKEPEVKEPEAKKNEAPAPKETQKPTEEKGGSALQSIVIIVSIIIVAAVVLFVGVKVLSKKK